MEAEIKSLPVFCRHVGVEAGAHEPAVGREQAAGCGEGHGGHPVVARYEWCRVLRREETEAEIIPPLRGEATLVREVLELRLQGVESVLVCVLAVVVACVTAQLASFAPRLKFRAGLCFVELAVIAEGVLAGVGELAAGGTTFLQLLQLVRAADGALAVGHEVAAGPAKAAAAVKNDVVGAGLSVGNGAPRAARRCPNASGAVTSLGAMTLDLALAQSLL